MPAKLPDKPQQAQCNEDKWNGYICNFRRTCLTSLKRCRIPWSLQLQKLLLIMAREHRNRVTDVQQIDAISWTWTLAPFALPSSSKSGKTWLTLTPVTPRLIEEISAVRASKARLMPLGRVWSVEKGPIISWNSMTLEGLTIQLFLQGQSC